MINVGVQTRPWGPEANRSDRPRILGEIAAAGYDGFEIGAQHLDIADPAQLQRQAAEQKLKIAGIHIGGEIYNPQSVEEALDNLEKTIAFAAAVGATFVPFSGKMKPDKTAKELRYQAENLNRIGEICRKNDLTLCYHNHFWEIENDCAELHHICDHTDPALVSLCLDVGWVQRAGSVPHVVAETFFERIGYFHLKDTTADEWREVGYGTVDFAELVELIRRKADWWLVIEQDETRRQPTESAQMSRTYLKEQFRI